MRRLMTEPSALSSEFWKAAADHRLVLPRCNRTGQYFFPPERCVPGTDSTDWGYVESGGRGTVYTFSVVHRPVSSDFEAPYVLAVVDLDEGVPVLTNIVECAPEAVRVGMPVEVTFLDVDGGSLPVYRPVTEH
jgi:uncharacterized OB-fold protein